MDERNLPALLRTAERRVNQHVWGDRRAVVSIPARPDEDVDLLLMEAAKTIEDLQSAHWQVMYRLADLLDADQFNNIEAIVRAAGVPYPPEGYDGRPSVSSAEGDPHG